MCATIDGYKQYFGTQRSKAIALDYSLEVYKISTRFPLLYY